MRRSSRSGVAASAPLNPSHIDHDVDDDDNDSNKESDSGSDNNNDSSRTSTIPTTNNSQQQKQPLSLTNDVLNKLGIQERQKVISLVTSLRGGQISKKEFLQTSQTLMNEKLFSILQIGINSMPSTHAPQPSINLLEEKTASAIPIMPSNNIQKKQQQQQSSFSTNEENDFDVNRLEDVMQYTGVDLKAENEIGLEQKKQIHIHNQNISNIPTFPTSLRYDSCFNGPRIKALISASVLPKGITDMGEDCLDLVALALKRRLLQVIEDLIQASKHRVDHGRASWKIRIENDPRKQVWLLEQFSKRMDDSVRAGKGIYGPMGLGGGGGGVGASLISSRPSSPPPIKTDPYSAMTAADIHQASKIAKNNSSSAPSATSAAGIDIKTKIANSTAAQATGLELKSWMTDPNVQKAAAAASSSGGAGRTNHGMSSESSFASAPSLTPINDRDLVNSLNNRHINMNDLIFVSENDPRLRGTTFLLSLYNHQNGK